MSIEIARYQFHPWARRGLSSQIAEADDLGAGTAATVERAEVAIGVTLNEAGLSKKFALLGPGDIIGVHREMVVRTEPLDWITDFESNYLAFLEFYDEDFAWRYTPAAPAGSRLRPWLFLLVLKEDEFERTRRRLPLPTITVKNKAAFPPPGETWMWAHVHSNADIPDSELSDYEKFLLSLNRTVNDDPDQLYCRLMSPRKLEPHTQYCAFLVPSFETGRLAGLEQPTETIAAQMPSWSTDGARGEMPFYYEWFFRTGANADFESLVRLLEPRPMPAIVGIRDMDCHRPGFVKADGSGELPGTSPPLIGLEGALKSPTTTSTVFPDPPTETAFQRELQAVVNLPFEIVGTDTSGDPIISLPLYGGKHAKKSATDVVKLDVTRNTWLHDLNRDPRWRVASGFGTTVVQKGQEEYMRKAWAQATRVLQANAQIKRTVFYMGVGLQLSVKTLTAIPKARLLAVSKPVLSKVMGSPTTILQQLRESRVPPAVFSGAFRRLVRPRAFTRKLSGAAPFDYGSLAQRLNDGKLTAAPPRKTPQGIPNTGDIANQILPRGWPAWLISLIRHRRLVLLVLLLLAVLAGFLVGWWLAGLLFVATAVAAWITRQLPTDLEAAESLTNPGTLADTIAAVAPQPGFSLTLSDEAVKPPPTPTTAGEDSVEARNFRSALLDFSKRLRIEVTTDEPVALDLDLVHAKVSAALDPAVAFPRRLVRLVQFPDYVPIAAPEKIFEAMAYPDFEEPMYKKLVDISGELLLPNLKVVPMNTISLLKTNQKFIESYLVGLNHEMGRELLWREYPTDERGSCFRQFWDVKGLVRPRPGRTEAQLTEEAKDIKPIHTWLSQSLLGRHNNRDAAGDGEQTVLLVRGDLLKRYPNTVIFAQKAIAGPNPREHLIDADLTADEFAAQLMFPLYRAELPPDIKLFGFDLTIDQARGTAPTPGFVDDLGWFFVIQEAPGEPRFGMDISFDPGTDGLSWDDLAWDRLPAQTRFIEGRVAPNLNVADKSRWGTDSANMAYVLFQKPTMIAVHATEMLQDLSDARA
jgi:hypothetical protein